MEVKYAIVKGYITEGNDFIKRHSNVTQYNGRQQLKWLHN